MPINTEMETRKLKRKKNKAGLSGFLKYFLTCVNPVNDPEDNSKVVIRPFINLDPLSELINTKQEASRTSTSLYMKKQELSPQKISLDVALSHAYLEKFENDSNEGQNPADSSETDREEKDQVVRAILGKYLALKRDDFSNKKPEVEDKKNGKFLQQDEKSEFLSIECGSTDSSETLILDIDSDMLRPKVEFPTKSKSAPTNSKAHDSLADICFRMNRFKQNEEKSDSYITCCSEENPKETLQQNKKKLELIFNQSSDEASCLEDNSSVSLQYKISCERSTVDSFTEDSLLELDRSEGVYLMKQTRKEKLAAQELYLHCPSAKGEIGENDGSNASLKWKLIISHHGTGDFR